jgi:DNA polymerase III alpha subunit
VTNILSVEEIGEEETCDLEVEHEDHQFYLANGVLTSNSHAVAYGFTSYQCAWLMTYYEAEWLCAYSEYMLGDKDKRDRALSEVKEFGYKLEKVDINFSERDWTIGSDGKSFYPGFKTVKGVGESAIQEILDNRPYTSIENFLWDESGEFRHSKFNKKAVSALTSIEAFDSMNLVGKDRLFPNYKAMQEETKLTTRPAVDIRRFQRRGRAVFNTARKSSDSTNDMRLVLRAPSLKILRTTYDTDSLSASDSK